MKWGSRQSHLQDFRVALATEGAQDEAPSLGGAGSLYGLQSGGPHGLVVIIFSRKHFTIWVIPADKKFTCTVHQHNTL